MTKKFDFKTFLRPQIWAPVAGAQGIRRRFAWNASRARYEDPARGSMYEARRVNGRKKRVSKVFSSLHDAREWRRSYEVTNFSNSAPAPNSHGKTVDELLHEFKKLRFPKLTEGTRINYESVFPAFSFFDGKEINALQPSNVSEWIRWLSAPERLIQGRSTRVSFKKELKVLRLLINWYREEYDEARLISPIRRKHFDNAQVRESTVRKVVLTNSELVQWLNELKKEDTLFHDLALLQTAQAMRVSESCAMKWTNLDFESGCYDLREHVVWPRIRGGLARLAPGTKTRREGYRIALWEETMEVLRQRYRNRSGDLVFSIDGGLLTYRQVQYAYNRAFEKAGLPHRSTHVCRHTGATAFLDKTQDQLALQQLGGWKNQTMPMHYAKIRASRLEQTMRAAEKRLKLISSKVDEEVS